MAGTPHVVGMIPIKVPNGMCIESTPHVVGMILILGGRGMDVIGTPHVVGMIPGRERAH